MSDGMLAKISADGSQLLLSTFIGGTGSDTANRAKLDVLGNIYVAGDAGSEDFPVANAVQPKFGGATDAFLQKLRRDGQVAYSTFLGGAAADSALGLAVDLVGNAHVTGRTESADFPTKNPIQASLKQFTDTFVSKLRPDGQQLVFSTYLGGSDNEFASGIALDLAGSVYVAGRTASPDYPTVNPLQPLAGTLDAFVTKILGDGSRIVYSTFFGGTAPDQALEVAVDVFGHAYLVGGTTTSLNFPVREAVQDHYSGFFNDGFVIKIDTRR